MLNKNERKHFIDLITNRFINNPRMSMFFDDSKKSFKKNVKNLVIYCFYIALRLDGIFISENGKTIVLFYEKKRFNKHFTDYLRYLRLILGIPLKKIRNVLASEKKVHSNMMKLENYIYIWFIAQEEGYGKWDGLIEINKELFKKAKEKNLPLLFETSDPKLLNLYKRAGFSVYNSIPNNNKITYFLADTVSVEKHKVKFETI